MQLQGGISAAPGRVPPGPVQGQRDVALPAELQLALHTTPCPERTLAPGPSRTARSLGCGQSLGFQATPTAKVNELVIFKTKDWEEEEEREGKKTNSIYKVFQFVGGVLRMKCFLLVPSGTLHPHPLNRHVMPLV